MKRNCDLRSTTVRPRSIIVFAVWGLAAAVFAQDSSSWKGDYFLLDLTRFYSQPISQVPGGRPWSVIPRGFRTLDGVPFLIGGTLEVAGMDAARHGDLLPTRVAGIPVHQKAGRLHVLHGAAHGHKEGSPLAKLVLHYASGETRSLRLAYGLHARNWIREPGERVAKPDDPNSRVAWSASGSEDDAFSGSLRFYHTPLDNPLPDAEIARLDVVSLFNKATPILFALTLERGGPPLLPVSEATAGKSFVRAYQFDDTAYTRDIVVQATGADGRTPLTNATAHLTLTDHDVSLFFAEAPADAQGRITLSYPAQETLHLGVQVRAPGHVPETMVKSAFDGGGIPREFTARLQRGVRIGGLVVDDRGQPIPGATVWIYRTTKTGPAEFTQTAFDSTVTDREGRWSTASVPHEFTGLRFELAHASFEPVTHFQDSDGPSHSVQVASTELLAGKVVMQMLPHLHVAGFLVDTKGRAVINAQVLVRMGPLTARYGERFRQNTRTDARGQFDVSVPERGEGALGVTAPGFAPEYRTVNVDLTAPPLRIVLGQGSPLRLRVRDQDGLPVPEASVSLNSWNNVRLVNWSGRTDTEGRVTWTNAPLGGLVFSVYKNDYSSTYTAIGSPADHEGELTLRRIFRVSGAVRDAETGELVEPAFVTPGRYDPGGEGILWSRGSQTRARKGHFSLPFYNEPAASPMVLVEAAGYLPATLGPFNKASSYTNEVKLKRGRGMSGRVLTPSGPPAGRASLVLLETGEAGQMNYSFEFRRQGYTGTYENTDRDGRFEFPPRPGARTVLASHATGFAAVPAEQVAGSGQIQLQRWGCVKGAVQLGDKPPTSVTVVLHNLERGPRSLGSPVSAFSLFLRTRPAPRGGNFLFDKVPPGDWQVSLLPWYRGMTGESQPFSHGVPVTVESGKTNTVALGGPGRTVTGRAQVTDGDPDDVDWLRDVHRLTLQVPGVPDIRPPNLAPAWSDAERRRLQKEYDERVRTFWASEQGRAVARAQRSYALLFESNGVFRVDAVPQGTYQLTLDPTDPTRDYAESESLGRVTRTVVVTAPKTDEPLDLGVIGLAIRPVVRLGEPAPPVKLKSFDGKPVMLENYRGRFVLLDFWDTLNESRSTDLDILRSFEDETNSTRLVVVSLNLDRDFKIADAYVKANPSKGPQCYVGPWEKTQAPAAFGLDTNNAAVVVLDPAGRIASRPIRGEFIRSTVRRLLNPPR